MYQRERNLEGSCAVSTILREVYVRAIVRGLGQAPKGKVKQIHEMRSLKHRAYFITNAHKRQQYLLTPIKYQLAKYWVVTYRRVLVGARNGLFVLVSYPSTMYFLVALFSHYLDLSGCNIEEDLRTETMQGNLGSLYSPLLPLHSHIA